MQSVGAIPIALNCGRALGRKWNMKNIEGSWQHKWKNPNAKTLKRSLWISFTPVYSAACFGTVCENLLYVPFIAFPSSPKLCLNETRIDPRIPTQVDSLVTCCRPAACANIWRSRIFAAWTCFQATPIASFHMFAVDSSKQSLTHSKPNWQVEIQYVGKLIRLSLRVFVWCFGLLVWNPRNSPQPLARSPFRRSSLPSFHDSLPTHSGDWRETHS